VRVEPHWLPHPASAKPCTSLPSKVCSLSARLAEFPGILNPSAADGWLTSLSGAGLLWCGPRRGHVLTFWTFSQTILLPAIFDSCLRPDEQQMGQEVIPAGADPILILTCAGKSSSALQKL
jgi:hypothetical protein